MANVSVQLIQRLRAGNPYTGVVQSPGDTISVTSAQATALYAAGYAIDPNASSGGSGNVTAEATRAQTAEAAETTRATGAEGSETSARSTADTAEVTARTTADTSEAGLRAAGDDSRWAANTTYKAGRILTFGSLTWLVNIDFTSGAAFSATNLTLLAGTEVAEMPYSTVTTFTATETAVSGWQIVVPANSGPVRIKLSNVLIALITSAQPANAQIYGQVKIKDEAGTMVAFGKKQTNSINTTSQTYVDTLSLECDLPNNAAAKTYSVTCQCSTVANGATVTMHTSASGFTDPQLKAIRR